MRWAQGVGRTVEEAAEAARARLGLDSGQFIVEVLEEPKGGFLGFLGARRLAKVVVRPERGFFSRRFLEEALEAAGVAARVDLQEGEVAFRLDVDGADVGFLIGRRGETLDSLQYLINVAAGRVSGKGKEIFLDIRGYRQRREQELRQMAQEAAEEVIQKGTDLVMRAMHPRDRKVIHMALQEHRQVTTRSQGEEPQRAVVISLRSVAASPVDREQWS